MSGFSDHFYFLLNAGPWWLIFPMAIILAFASIRLYRRETERLPKGGALLRGLRAAIIVLLVLLLSQPILTHSYAKFEQPVVIVLRDVSASMHVKDANHTLEQRLRATERLGLIAPDLRSHLGENMVTLVHAATSTTLALSKHMSRDWHRKPDAQAFTQALKQVRQNLQSIEQQYQDINETIISSFPENEALLNSGRELTEKAEALKKTFTSHPMKVMASQTLLKKMIQQLDQLTQKSRNLAKQAQAFQDRADRTLGESDRPEIIQALSRYDQMDRSARVRAMLDQIKKQYDGKKIRLVVHDFDTRLHTPAPNLRSIEDAASTKSNAKTKSRRKRDDTDLASPLLTLTKRHARDRIAAVVLCSDGRHTMGPDPLDAARILAARGIPLHTIGVGNLTHPKDICIARLDGTQAVFKDETIRMTAHIKVTNMLNQKAMIVLRRGTVALQQRPLTFQSDGWRRETFELTAHQSGPANFSVSIQPLAGEALTNNNDAQFMVDVATDQLKALVVDTYPRWETRYVASLLRRERKMLLQERWLETDASLGPQAPALPGEANEFNAFDIVVLGDLPPNRLPLVEQKRLEKYVSERGGFLVIIAGPDAMPREYTTGPMAALLPITQQAPTGSLAPVAPSGGQAGGSGTDWSASARLQMNPEQSEHEILRIFRDPRLNEALWPALPELHWIFRNAYPKPGAISLLQTNDARKDLVVGAHYFGNGRVLYVGTDETWRWRTKLADRVHSVFWSQAFRWGTSNRLTGGPKLKAALTRTQIRPHEDLEVIARPRTLQGKPDNKAVVIAEHYGKQHRKRVRMLPVPGSGGLYRGTFKNVGAGVHRIRVFLKALGNERSSITLQAIAREVSGQEGVELSLDRSRLMALAKVGNGRFLKLKDAPKIFSELSGKGKERIVTSSYVIWSSYPAMLLIVGLLVAEWTLRKRWGLA